MSITAAAREEKRDLIPSVVHVDGSARLQTVTKEQVQCCQHCALVELVP